MRRGGGPSSLAGTARTRRRLHQEPSVKVSFLVPVYNEERTVATVIERLRELPLDSQIVVVDDGSTDGTPARLSALAGDDLVVITQANRGKGAAVRAAIPHADGDVIVIQDADLEYDPRDVPGLIEPIVDGVADVVYGSRL